MPTPAGMKALGYQQITSLSSAQALTVPAGTMLALIIPQTQSVRWRDDGTSPTASVGQPLAVGQELEYDSANIASLKFIEQTASAAINVTYFGQILP